jgi:hypothetical protein
VLGRNGNDIILRNYKYDIYTYPDVEEEMTGDAKIEKQYMRKPRRSRKAKRPSRKTVPVSKNEK